MAAATASAEEGNAGATVPRGVRAVVKSAKTFAGQCLAKVRKPPTTPDAISWDELKSAEAARVHRRRVWLAARGRIPNANPSHTVGLALSGGGIRSATFSLGVLRSLSKKKLLWRLDYLSTVSGGGYAGSFYCSLFVPPKKRGIVADPSEALPANASEQARLLDEDVFEKGLGRDAIEQVRQGGNFLNPNGTSDTLFAAIVAFRNWLAVALVSGMALLAMFMFVTLPREAPNAKATPHFDPSPLFAEIGGSWAWFVALAFLPLWIAPTAWAYWFTRGNHIPESRARRLVSLPSAVAVVVAGVVLWLWLDRNPDLPGWRELGMFDVAALALILSAGLALAAYGLAEGVSAIEESRDGTEAQGSEPAPAGESPAAQAARLVAEEDRVRTKLSRWLTKGVFLAAAVAGIALADDAGRLIYGFKPEQLENPFTKGALGAVPLAIIAAARWLLKRVEVNQFLAWPKLGPLIHRFARFLALIAGAILLFLLASFWSAAAHFIVWRGEAVPEVNFAAMPQAYHILLVLIATLIALCLGKVHGFLNQSSLASFYSGRLRRAYLGATNTDRIKHKTPADVELATDDMQLGAYYGEDVLAPVHLINVTVNETTSRSSRVIQRDRKGKPMTLSPAGYIVATKTPGADPVGFPHKEGEQLPLSAWMGISGAAVATGMGQHGSLGLSLLAGLSNMRLGYWWDSPYPGRLPEGAEPGEAAPPQPKRSLLAGARNLLDDLVQGYLLREIWANFEGTYSNRWYLSDGGHYENLGVYELVRRRIPFIIACDNGADPSYAFGDLVNLVRKIRIDFEAETEFLSTDELDRRLGKDTLLRSAFGTLEDMVPREGEEEKGRTGPYAALARIRYQRQEDRKANPPTPPSTLLLIKPRVTGGELPDLLRYKRSNVAFPQQPTTDLFFDEAQWESYYRLGQLLTDTIFDEAPAAAEPPAWQFWAAPTPRWRPFDLEPLPDP